MNEAIQLKTTQMLLKERLDRAEQRRMARRAVNHRASRDQDRPRLEASRKPCPTTEQAAY
jgi:hypothetical protein